MNTKMIKAIPCAALLAVTLLASPPKAEAAVMQGMTASWWCVGELPVPSIGETEYLACDAPSLCYWNHQTGSCAPFNPLAPSYCIRFTSPQACESA